MKYWRGYLVAAILAACTWAFREFAQTHSQLVDMVYPYVTRMVQTFMANWSSGVDYCLWQGILLALIAVAEQMSMAYRQAMIGTRQEVLFEEVQDGLFTGHAPNYMKIYVKGENLHNEVRGVIVEKIYKDGLFATEI